VEIIYLKIKDLKSYKNNPRKISQKAVDSVASSIEKFGFKQPLVVSSENEVVVGHTRLKAAKKLKYKEVPCFKADDLTEEQLKAYRIADNKTHEFSSWDDEKLNEELAKLKEMEFDMSDFDFDMDFDEIETGDDNFNADEAIEKIEKQDEDISINHGEVWKLGNHRLMCGDSTNENDIKKLIDGNKIDMVFTDPPYSFDKSGKWRESTSGNRATKLNENLEGLIDFEVKKIKHILDLEIYSFYICTNKKLIRDYLNLFKDYNYNILTWCKTNSMPLTNNSFMPDIEYILYFCNQKRIWNNRLKPVSIYSKYYVSSKEEGSKDTGKLHPTMKPIKIILDKIKISSNKNGIVLDLFGGSGSTLIACEQTNRNCYMMEIDSVYCRVIIERWEQLTGKKAELLEGE
jgi:site-specific DNA-methyltransferase (adenine-specific)